jgi:hypothetical protein
MTNTHKAGQTFVLSLAVVRFEQVNVGHENEVLEHELNQIEEVGSVQHRFTECCFDSGEQLACEYLTLATSFASVLPWPFDTVEQSERQRQGGVGLFGAAIAKQDDCVAVHLCSVVHRVARRNNA